VNQCSQCARDVREPATTCDACADHPGDDVSLTPLPSEPGSKQIFLEEQIPLDSVESPADAASADRSPSAPPSAARFGRREVLTALGALAFGGIVTFAALIGSTARSSDAATVLAVRTRNAAESESKATRSGASAPVWSSANREWVGGERRAVAFELPADNTVLVWQRRAHPILVIRCFKKRTEAFVFIESAAQIEPRGGHAVRIRFDAEPEREERWPDDEEHDALFAPDGAAFARRLTAASTLQFGYKPHNSPPVVAEFHVSGLGALMAPAEAQCSSRP
jgi:hypothetical protein